MDENSKKIILQKLRILNEFIRQLEEFSKLSEIDCKEDRIYISALAQRKILREILNMK